MHGRDDNGVCDVSIGAVHQRGQLSDVHGELLAWDVRVDGVHADERSGVLVLRRVMRRLLRPGQRYMRYLCIRVLL